MKTLAKIIFIVLIFMQSPRAAFLEGYTWHHALPLTSVLGMGLPFAVPIFFSRIKSLWTTWNCPDGTVAQCYLGNDEVDGRQIPMQKCVSTQSPSDLKDYPSAVAYFQNATKAQGDLNATVKNMNEASGYTCLLTSVVAPAVPWALLLIKHIFSSRASSSSSGADYKSIN